MGRSRGLLSGRDAVLRVVVFRSMHSVPEKNSLKRGV